MSLPFLDYLTPSFELHLRAEAKARSTIRIYVAAVRQFAEWIAAADPSAVSWDRVTEAPPLAQMSVRKLALHCRRPVTGRDRVHVNTSGTAVYVKLR